MKVSPLLVVAKALILAVRRNPQVNATWDEAAGEIVVKHYVNLGIAAATPRGLVVPEHQGRRPAVAAAAGRRPRRAHGDGARGPHPARRHGRRHDHDHERRRLRHRLRHADPQPGRGRDPRVRAGRGSSPWVHKGKVRPRWVTQLALSFDHRLVDGDLGSRTLADVAAVLEDPSRALVWG